MTLPSSVTDAIQRIAADRTSGAAALVLDGLAVLREAAADAALVRRAALALCAAQPAMAGFHTVAAVVASATDCARTIEAVIARLRRAPDAIARAGVPLLRLRRSAGQPLRVITHSRSGLVERVLRDVNAAEPVQVCCSESRPGSEGRLLAEALAAEAVAVDLYTDAGLSTAVAGADALLLGADAVSEDAIVNKVGSGALCALARALGVPVVVLAGAEKIVPQSVFALLAVDEGCGPTRDATSPALVSRNPVFERVPSELIGQVVTDRGALLPAQTADAGFWTSAVEYEYMSLMRACNVLDKR